MAEIEQADFEFLPPTVQLDSTEEAISVKIINSGSTDHTFTIDDLDVDEVLAPGDSSFVVFSEPGQYGFYCRFHPDQMIGGLGIGFQTLPPKD